MRITCMSDIAQRFPQWGFACVPVHSPLTGLPWCYVFMATRTAEVSSVKCSVFQFMDTMLRAKSPPPDVVLAIKADCCVEAFEELLGQVEEYERGLACG